MSDGVSALLAVYWL